MKEHLRVRQVLAQSRPKEDSFTAMVASLGKPKATSSVRRKTTSAGASSKSRAAAARFIVDSSGSDDVSHVTPVKGKSELLSLN